MKQMELRMDSSNLSTNKDGTLTVSGYVNKTDKLSEVMGVSKKFREKISKGAFRRAIQTTKKDIDFLAEHDNKKILASTRNGSLTLREDNQGLYMEATITATSWGKDYYELIKDNILQNMSFGFRTIKDTWKNMGDFYERTIDELELYEVSVVKNPAYSQSTIAARSIEVIEEPEIKVEVKKEVEEKEVPLDLRAKEIKLEIGKTEQSINSFRRMEELTGESHDFLIQGSNNKLAELKNELRNIEKQMEEDKMNEERVLQTSTNNPEVDSIKGVGVSGEIIEKLEHTSNAYARARKVPFIGEEMKVPFETDLPDAAFVQGEGFFIPEAELGIDSFGTLKQKRTGLSISFSKKYMYDSGVDLTQYVKNLLTKRVAKAIEKSILAGKEEHEFKGIAHDVGLAPVTVSPNPTLQQLKELSLDVHEDYAKNSVWYMNRTFYTKVSNLIDESGNYVVKYTTVDNKIVPTLFGYPIEISDALDTGSSSNHVPTIFGSIEDAYTIGVSREFKTNVNSTDTTQALRGSVAITADFYGDGMVTNYDAIAKGQVL